MATEDIPQEVIRFLAEHVESAVQLEVLLLVQSRPDVNWQATDVARELRISAGWTEESLAKLAGAGILEPVSSAYRYAPRSAETAQTIAALAKCYADRRVTIISLIFSKPPDPIRQFSDAFRFRKGEDK